MHFYIIILLLISSCNYCSAILHLGSSLKHISCSRNEEWSHQDFVCVLDFRQLHLPVVPPITTVTLNHVFFDSDNITGVTLPFLFKKLYCKQKGRIIIVSIKLIFLQAPYILFNSHPCIICKKWFYCVYGRGCVKNILLWYGQQSRLSQFLPTLLILCIIIFLL